MSNFYKEEAKEIKEAFKDYVWNVNEYLPDEKGKFQSIEWEEEGVMQLVGNYINEFADKIIHSEAFSNHSLGAMVEVKERYLKALKSKDISQCQSALVYAHKEFFIVYKSAVELLKRTQTN